MFYIILSAIVFLWFLSILIRRKLTWHSIISIFTVSLVLVDIFDIVASRILNLYTLHLNLLPDKSEDAKHAIVISDSLIMPLIAIIFCYYYSKFKKWWIPILLPVILVLIEGVFVHFKYIVYKNSFDPLYTAALYVIGMILLTCHADRFINYSPPIPYQFTLFFSTYVIMGQPGATFGGASLNFFHWKPGIFADTVADNWFVEISSNLIFGLIASTVVPRLNSRRLRSILFISFGISGAVLSLIMHSKGILIYQRWNNVYQILRYISPSIILILYDRWQSSYTEMKIRQQ